VKAISVNATKTGVVVEPVLANNRDILYTKAELCVPERGLIRNISVKLLQAESVVEVKADFSTVLLDKEPSYFCTDLTVRES